MATRDFISVRIALSHRLTKRKHTDKDYIELLSSIPRIKYTIVDEKYVHTKLFYFSTGESYTILVGSANVTYDSLVRNEESAIFVPQI